MCVDGVRSLPGDKSEVIIYIVERQTNGATRRILATELYAFLNQDANKTKLKGLGVENMIAKTALSESQLSQVCFNFYIISVMIIHGKIRSRTFGDADTIIILWGIFFNFI